MSEQAGLFESEIYGVSRVVTYIDKLLRGNKRLQSVRIRGEVSNLRTLKGGHLTFDLKEGVDLLACILWSSNTEGLASFDNGAEVIATGDLAAYRQASKYQMYVAALELSGVGKLYAQLELLKRRFRAEGLFDPARKRPLPRFPRRVALISAKGKGAEDFVSTLSARAPQIQIDFIESRVQGVGAEIDIAEAIDRASRVPGDLIVLARGGGTFEDLFPFNLEPVIRAIVRAQRPVLTAIGHTGDRHLADEVADFSAATPSNAAQHLGALRDSALQLILGLKSALDSAVKRTILEKVRQADALTRELRRCAESPLGKPRERLWHAQDRLNRQSPESRIRERGRRFERARISLQGSARSVLNRAKHRSEIVYHRLEALSPQGPLTRGYAIVLLNGKVLRDASSASPGELIDARLQHGTLQARVERQSADA